MNFFQLGNDIVLSNYNNFDLAKTFNCGQCFRWDLQSDGSFIGFIDNQVINVIEQDNLIYFKNLNINHHLDKIIQYFDLKRNYQAINDELSNLFFISDACHFSQGIRILKQNPWETLISFIISQNNNIPRIKKIINTLCYKFGKPLGNNLYSFPSFNDLANISINDLADIKCGFRDKYIIDAIDAIKSKRVILDDLFNLNSSDARNLLMKIKGVGPKVADCVLLYAFSKFDCFPTDTWIKKTLNSFFKNGLPNINPDYLGFVQQYIFYYVRNTPNIFSSYPNFC